jgi:hypothetical protein
MTTDLLSDLPDDAADADELAFYRQTLRRLTEVGMELLQAARAEVQAGGAKALRDMGLLYDRVSRSIRLTIMLAMRSDQPVKAAAAHGGARRQAQAAPSHAGARADADEDVDEDLDEELDEDLNEDLDDYEDLDRDTRERQSRERPDRPDWDVNQPTGEVIAAIGRTLGQACRALGNKEAERQVAELVALATSAARAVAPDGGEPAAADTGAAARLDAEFGVLTRPPPSGVAPHAAMGRFGDGTSGIRCGPDTG